MTTDDETVRVALIHEVFFDDLEGARLRVLLGEAKDAGADVAVLPELPLNEWSPYTTIARDEDAESVGGRRQATMSAVAADIGIAVVGGAIIRDESSGTRHNTAIVYAPDGQRMASYRKIHLPEEEGYFETSHYEPGRAGPKAFDGLGLRAGLQICSDVNRPQGFQLLAAQGSEVVFVPRATPPETYDRWRLVLRANAAMSGAYVVSANRPRPEHGASIGGPSLVIAPDGSVLAETSDPVHVVEISRGTVRDAAAEYPGYLKRFPSVYAEAWGRLTD